MMESGMADGDVIVDEVLTLSDGSTIDLFAIENTAYPGEVNYRFTWYDPEEGAVRLRYDNSQVSRHGVGVHHRHDPHGVESVEFESVASHLDQFRAEVFDQHE